MESKSPTRQELLSAIDRVVNIKTLNNHKGKYRRREEIDKEITAAKAAFASKIRAHLPRGSRVKPGAISFEIVGDACACSRQDLVIPISKSSTVAKLLDEREKLDRTRETLDAAINDAARALREMLNRQIGRPSPECVAKVRAFVESK